jgi:hypothetical protein
MAFGDEAVRQLTVPEWYKCFKCGEQMWEGDCHAGHSSVSPADGKMLWRNLDG